jgi:hypothetical protein
MDDSRVRKASDLLGSLLSPEASAKADTWSSFFGFWNRAAGENLAAHSRPVDVRNGIVFVEATHPGWIQLLQMDQNRILATIRRTFPELGVSGIAFKLAKDASMPGTARITRPTTFEAAAEGAQGASDSADGDRARCGVRVEAAPTVEQTIRSVEDESFRGILSSLVETLEEADKETRGRKGKPE